MEFKVKHLEMIEAVIQRMGSNSFQLKGWAVTLVVLTGGLAAQGTNKVFFLLGFIPLFAFWALDAYYLLLERRYIALYKAVAANKSCETDFNMDVTSTIDMSESDGTNYRKCLFSRTVAPFYSLLVLSIVVLAIILICT